MDNDKIGCNYSNTKNYFGIDYEGAFPLTNYE